MKLRTRFKSTLFKAASLGVVLVMMSALSADAGENVSSPKGKIVADTVVDIDGNKYETVIIGAHTWMAENLKVTHYRDGGSIPCVSDDTWWSALTGGAYCWYDDDPANKDTYGALYNFNAISDSCGLCPEGWHVPSESEWLELVAHLGGEIVAGGKMKESDAAHWKKPNIGATDESGFHGLLGGGRGRISGYGGIGEYATWWSSTSYDSMYAWHWGLYRGNEKVRFNPGHKASGFSVRCVKD
jgi:uncharacterized protein (TIGR02145 family)